MESFVITWRELLIVVAVVLAIYVAEMLLLLRAKRTDDPKVVRSNRATDSLSTQRFEEIESAVSELSQRIAKLEAGLEQLQRPTPPVAHPAQTPYSQAIQMAQQGLDASAVAASCGISRGEAELIVAMHRARQS